MESSDVASGLSPVAANYAMPIPETRTPFQVALLCVSTFGIYFFVWLGRQRWLAENVLKRQHRHPLTWLLLPIPIASLVVVLGAADVIQTGVRERQQKAGPIPFWLYSWLGGLFFSPWVAPIMQSYIYFADMEDRRKAGIPFSKPRLNAYEIAAIILGILLELAAIPSEYGVSADDGNGYLILAVFFYLASLIPFAIVTSQTNAKLAHLFTTMQCPFCRSDIPNDATVCRFCQRDLAGTPGLPG